MSESSVACGQAVIYHFNLETNAWDLKGDGYSRIDIYFDSVKNQYRVVALSSRSEPVINSRIFKDLSYYRNSSTFHQWADKKTLYGLRFYSDLEAEKFAGAMKSAVQQVTKIEETKERQKAGQIDNPGEPGKEPKQEAETKERSSLESSRSSDRDKLPKERTDDRKEEAQTRTSEERDRKPEEKKSEEKKPEEKKPEEKKEKKADDKKDRKPEEKKIDAPSEKSEGSDNSEKESTSSDDWKSRSAGGSAGSNWATDVSRDRNHAQRSHLTLGGSRETQDGGATSARGQEDMSPGKKPSPALQTSKGVDVSRQTSARPAVKPAIPDDNTLGKLRRLSMSPPSPPANTTTLDFQNFPVKEEDPADKPPKSPVSSERQEASGLAQQKITSKPKFIPTKSVSSATLTNEQTKEELRHHAEKMGANSSPPGGSFVVDKISPRGKMSMRPADGKLPAVNMSTTRGDEVTRGVTQRSFVSASLRGDSKNTAQIARLALQSSTPTGLNQDAEELTVRSRVQTEGDPRFRDNIMFVELLITKGATFLPNNSPKAPPPGVPKLMTRTLDYLLEEKAVTDLFEFEYIDHLERLERLRNLIEKGDAEIRAMTPKLTEHSPHHIAEIVKRYFRDYPGGIINLDNYDPLYAFTGLMDDQSRLKFIHEIVDSLSPTNKTLLDLLITC